MNVIWLKRDCRLRDHGPLAHALEDKNPFLLLYIYEPDQLGQSTVHGSHINFVNEGLVDLGARIERILGLPPTNECSGVIHINTGEATAVLSEIHSKRRIAKLLSHMETGHTCSYERDKRGEPLDTDDELLYALCILCTYTMHTIHSNTIYPSEKVVSGQLCTVDRVQPAGSATRIENQGAARKGLERTLASFRW